MIKKMNVYEMEANEMYNELMKIDLKAERRKRITKDDLEIYFKIAYALGYNNAKEKFENERKDYE